MHPTHALRRAAAIIGALLLTLTAATPTLASANQNSAATPPVTYSCDDIQPSGTPVVGQHHHGDQETMPHAGTPMPAHDDHGGHMMGTDIEFDLMYIDMMIPHHESIIAMAQAALPELSDERLISMAENIIATQDDEIEQLRQYRTGWYGSAETMPMDDAFMAAMEQTMPGAHDAMGGMVMMDAEALVRTFCAQPDADVAFIDLTIPHHQGAIIASEAALEQATHPEIVEMAQAVIDVQQAEIDELQTIREELTGDPNPAPVLPVTPA